MTEDDLFTVVDVEAPPAREGAPSGDPEAPYGRKADGTPYKRRPSGPRGPRATSAAGKGKAESKAVADVVTSLYGIVVMILSTLARAFKSTPLMADAIVVDMARPKVVPPLTAVVANNAQLVEMCVRLSRITPGVELIGVLLPLIGQVATNHGMVPGAENQSEKIVAKYMAETTSAETNEDA